MRIDETEAIRRAQEISGHDGNCGAEYMPGEICGECDDISKAIRQAVLETATECAAIARFGETSGQCLTGIGVERDIKTAYGL